MLGGIACLFGDDKPPRRQKKLWKRRDKLPSGSFSCTIWRTLKERSAEHG